MVIDQTEAVGPDHADTRALDGGIELLFDRRARFSGLTEPAGEDDGPLDSFLGATLQHARHDLGRSDDQRQIDSVGKLFELGVNLVAVLLAAYPPPLNGGTRQVNSIETEFHQAIDNDPGDITAPEGGSNDCDLGRKEELLHHGVPVDAAYYSSWRVQFPEPGGGSRGKAGSSHGVAPTV